MENKKKYIELKNLEVYQLSRELSRIGWSIYESLDWQMKKIMGDQFIESTDSIGANIAEGYGRFHFLDKIRFYYNSRGSLFESQEHWLDLLLERNKLEKQTHNKSLELAKRLSVRLNNLITSTYKAKDAN